MSTDTFEWPCNILKAVSISTRLQGNLTKYAMKLQEKELASDVIEFVVLANANYEKY